MPSDKSTDIQFEQNLSDVSANQTLIDEVSCVALIQEFLLYKDLKKTSSQLQNECKEINLDCTIKNAMEMSISKEEAQIISSKFNKEEFDAFVELWESKVPVTAHATDPETWRLLFLAHVDLATKHPEVGMDKLKRFIVQKPITANQNEMLQYYALPYITNPQKHPSFAHLYKEDWSTDLRSSIASFLQRYTRPHNKPRIMQLLNSSSDHWQASHRQVKKRFRQLQGDYQRLLGVASELTSALECAVRGETPDLASTLRNCTSIFPELFPHRDPGNRSSPESVLRRSLSQGRRTAGLTADFELDFRKIKAHLASPENNKTRLLLMQALRWRITHSSVEDRDHTVAAIVRHDLLGLRGGFCLLNLLAPPEGETPHPLQQGVARLGNALASLRAGRDYLSTQPDHVVPLVSACVTGAMPRVLMDDITEDMLLALLQKLSLRRSQREAMITSGVVEWLIPKLETCLAQLTRPDTPTYALEYATALLMNLCLHSRAKQRCVPLSGRTLKLLTAMLGSAPRQVLPYVNGALYSLLSEPLINQQAKHMGLEKVLQFYLKQSEGELSPQLEHILRLHRGDCGPEPPETHSEDEGEADIAFSTEVLEEELDSGDPVRATGAEPAGEELLRGHYRQLFPAHGVVTPKESAPLGSSSLPAVPASPLMSRRQDGMPRLNTPLPPPKQDGSAADLTATAGEGDATSLADTKGSADSASIGGQSLAAALGVADLNGKTPSSSLASVNETPARKMPSIAASMISLAVADAIQVAETQVQTVVEAAAEKVADVTPGTSSVSLSIKEDSKSVTSEEVTKPEELTKPAEEPKPEDPAIEPTEPPPPEEPTQIKTEEETPEIPKAEEPATESKTEDGTTDPNTTTLEPVDPEGAAFSRQPKLARTPPTTRRFQALTRGITNLQRFARRN